MESIKISTGVKLAINDDPERVIAFDPEDLNFVEDFYNLIEELEVKEKEFREKAELLENDKQVDDYGVPRNMRAVINLAKESCEYLKDKIDQVFGVDTSQKAFGKSMSLDMFRQFFEGVSPYINNARVDKIEKYTNRAASRIMR